AVAVEIVATGHALGKIAGAGRVQEAIGALGVPAIPRVEVGSPVAFDLRAFRALDDHFFVRPQVDRLATRRDDARLAAAAADEGGGFVVDVDAVVARVLDGGGEIGRVELDRMSALQAPEVEPQVTRGDLELQEVRLDVVECDVRFASGAQVGTCPDLYLEVRALPGVQRIARGERCVDARRRPVLRSRPPERHLAVGEAQTGRRGDRRGLRRCRGFLASRRLLGSGGWRRLL